MIYGCHTHLMDIVWMNADHWPWVESLMVIAKLKSRAYHLSPVKLLELKALQPQN